MTSINNAYFHPFMPKEGVTGLFLLPVQDLQRRKLREEHEKEVAAMKERAMGGLCVVHTVAFKRFGKTILVANKR